MQLDLVTLDGIKARNDVYEVLLPTSIGMIAVFPGHMPLVTLIDNGIISIRYKKSDGDDQMDHFATYGGARGDQCAGACHRRGGQGCHGAG